MQHHPGSWYIPWGMPLQKMMAVPFHPAAAGYHQPQIAAAAPPQAQQTPATNYQHQMHQAAALHNSAAMQHQQLHPAAAAAMFTPLALRSFVTHQHMSQQSLGAPAQQPPPPQLPSQSQSQLNGMTLSGAHVNVLPVRQASTQNVATGAMIVPMRKVSVLAKYMCIHSGALWRSRH
jgi:hypothetical protein